MLKLHIHTFPDPTPMPTVAPDTVEHDGRYSEGSHKTFSDLYVTHAPSKLNPPPSYWRCGEFATIVLIVEVDDALIAIVPISV